MLDIFQVVLWSMTLLFQNAFGIAYWTNTVHRVESYNNGNPSISGCRRSSLRLQTTILQATQQQQDFADISSDLKIRSAKYSELNECAEIILESFYKEDKKTGIWRQLYRMGELNRIQQSYSYGDDTELHQMLVATIPKTANDDDEIVGFVDIDIRPAQLDQTTFSYNPRPYLSDLCIDTNFRRQGIAKALIEYCELFCLQLTDDALKRANSRRPKVPSEQPSIRRDELYIRVMADNYAALKMYETLGYRPSNYNPDDPKSENVIILHKYLSSR